MGYSIYTYDNIRYNIYGSYDSSIFEYNVIMSDYYEKFIQGYTRRETYQLEIEDKPVAGKSTDFSKICADAIDIIRLAKKNIIVKIK